MGSNICITLSTRVKQREVGPADGLVPQIQGPSPRSRSGHARTHAEVIGYEGGYPRLGPGDCVVLSCIVHESSEFWRKPCDSEDTPKEENNGEHRLTVRG